MSSKRPPKNIIVIGILSAIILLGAGAYTWQSLAAWKGYETRLLSEREEYQQLKDAAFNATSPKDRLVAIRKLDDKLADRGNLCKVNGLFAWQARVVPMLGDGVKACETEVKRLNLVAAPLSGLRDILDTAEKLQSSVTKLVPSDALNDKNWAQKGLGAAKAVQDELKGLKLDGDSKELAGTASNLTDNLVKAWESLIKADEAEDRSAFVAASAEVTKAYANFASLADTADSLIQPRIQEVIDAIR